jgi:glyoxylase-like metal-dependent hydrolase (beta-lactamase superfamily II)
MSTLPPTSPTTKLPTSVFPNIFAFPPNRDTLGGTAYLIIEPTGNILVDSPAWSRANRDFLIEMGGVKSIFLTHRGGSGRVTEIATELECHPICQEQEAYTIPEIKVTTFQHQFNINDRLAAIWTPGHSPGSSCLYYNNYGGVLFSGRHLLPDATGLPVPLKMPKTFHWPRQLRSVATIWTEFPASRLRYICPGANVGLLRGRGSIDLNPAVALSLDISGKVDIQD